jgi:hypothetical protein
MALSQKDLDGKYRITTISDYQGPLPLQSDGETEIVEGRTDRFDKKGCHWTTRLTILNDNEVKFEATADPLEADDDFLLIGANGMPTREPVDYMTVLNVAQKDGRIRLSGQIEHGKIITVITMIKI